MQQYMSKMLIRPQTKLLHSLPPDDFLEWQMVVSNLSFNSLLRTILAVQVEESPLFTLMHGTE